MMICLLPAKIPDIIDGGAHMADNMVGEEPDHDGSDGDTVSYEKSEEGVTVDLAATEQVTETDGVDENDIIDAGDPTFGMNPEGSYASR